jgi:hypothetical protein
MANNDNTSFPYQHLDVLGIKKLKKYVPPAASGEAPSRRSSPRMDSGSQEPAATKRDDK